MKALPIEFVSRMKTLLGDDGFARYEKAISEPSLRAFRVNTDKIPLREFEAAVDFEIEKVPYVQNGYFFGCDRIGNHPFHHAGMIYVQESAAMMPAECLDISPDWKILDLCAAPGGKSSQLKNKLGERGLLVSNEIVPSRCKILVGNIERLGLLNTVVTCENPEKIAEEYPKFFDMIMVDAPCSGEGMFRKEEVAIDEWSLDNVKRCAVRQAQILECAARALKRGGYIVYSTCTFSLEENEMTVDRFLSAHPEFEILPVKDCIRDNSEDGIFFDGCQCKNISYARRVYPHTVRGEGQFMALLHNVSEPYAQDIPKASSKKQKLERGSSSKSVLGKDGAEMKAVTDFLDGILTSYDKNAVQLRNGRAVYFSHEIFQSNVTVFSCGVNIGEVKKNYIQPHHSLFMALGGSFKRKLELSTDSEELKKYLHGEELSVDLDDGWAAVTVCGCAVGGVKVVSGVAKNHYPKGLRTK